MEDDSRKTGKDFLSKLRHYIDNLIEWDDLLALKDQKTFYPTGEIQIAPYWQILCAGITLQDMRRPKEGFIIGANLSRGARFFKKLNVRDVGTPDTMTVLVSRIDSLITVSKDRFFTNLMEPTLKT